MRARPSFYRPTPATLRRVALAFAPLDLHRLPVPLLPIAQPDDQQLYLAAQPVESETIPETK